MTSTATEHPALSVVAVSKAYGATIALDDVTFSVARGEVHALLGHNGSGKSTLVKAIGGAVIPDQGTLTVGSLGTAKPRVGLVHQELALCRDATVLENCCMGGYRRRWGCIDWRTERAVVGKLLRRLGAGFDSGVVVGELSPADQAITAIARALKAVGDSDGLDLLVLDEATASLRGPDAEKVLSVARRVASSGGGVLLVTHHMSEVLSSANRATVLSNGAVAATVDVAGATQDSLLERVNGRPLSSLRHPAGSTSERAGRRTLLSVSGLTTRSVHHVDLTVREGEIVGLTGAAGGGHDDVPYALTGFESPTGGKITIDGTRLSGHTLTTAQRAGLGILPADRLTSGVLATATIRENLSPPSRGMHRAKGILRSREERLWAEKICAEYEISTQDTEALISSLSGGNQQKIVLARVLESRPKVAILHEPTQGIDEATRRDLVGKIRGLAASGAGVLYVSSDVEEVTSCADRIIVMQRGVTVSELPGGLEHLDDIYAACYGTTAASATT
jgi:ribose transport system ATP-binding protein